MRLTTVTVRGSRAGAGSPEQAVWQVLGTVIDPEVGIPITELGLVYSVEVGDGRARVVMTTTTPVCPLGAFMQRQIERGLADVNGIESVEVEIVHTPRWCPDMITETGRSLLGW
jgi:metal-sulfur cluster biosynthetic enzyme